MKTTTRTLIEGCSHDAKTNPIVIGRQSVGAVCNACWNAYAASNKPVRRRAAKRPMATTGAQGEWNAFASLVLGVSKGARR